MLDDISRGGSGAIFLSGVTRSRGFLCFPQHHSFQSLRFNVSLHRNKTLFSVAFELGCQKSSTRFLFVILSMYIAHGLGDRNVCARDCRCHRGQRHQNLLELQVQQAQSCPMWMLGTEIRAAPAFNPRATSPIP